MKRKIKKIVLPMAIALIAVGGAFASSKSKQAESTLVDKNGYYLQGITCKMTETMCSTIYHEEMCSDGVNYLFDWNGTDCETPLYRK